MFGRPIYLAIQLAFVAEGLDLPLVVLVRPHVILSEGKGESIAVDKQDFEDVGMPAA